MGSVLLAICVNVERMFAVVFPLKTFSYKKWLIGSSVVVAVTYNIPKYFEIEVEDYDASEAGKRIVTTDLRKDPIYNSVYAFWSKLIFFELFPYVAIMVCNVVIICKVYKASKFRSKFNGSNLKSSLRRAASSRFSSSAAATKSSMFVSSSAAPAASGMAMTATVVETACYDSDPNSTPVRMRSLRRPKRRPKRLVSRYA